MDVIDTLTCSHPALIFAPLEAKFCWQPVCMSAFPAVHWSSGALLMFTGSSCQQNSREAPEFADLTACLGTVRIAFGHKDSTRSQRPTLSNWKETIPPEWPTSFLLLYIRSSGIERLTFQDPKTNINLLNAIIKNFTHLLQFYWSQIFSFTGKIFS